MEKLTAEKCRALILILHRCRNFRIISTREERYLEALEIALPVLEQQESQCQKCGGTGMADSGGTQPWGEQILVECDCQFEQQEKDGWIEWGGGACPVIPGNRVDLKLRGGVITNYYPAECAQWSHHKYNNNSDIIAYRVIEQQERERGEEA